MQKEWFTPQELAEIEGVTTYTINKRAKKENWTRRKRKGVQGRAHEFHIQHLTPEQQKKLSLRENPGAWITEPQDPQTIWASTWQILSEQEKQSVTSFIMRYGAQKLLEMIKNRA